MKRSRLILAFFAAVAVTGCSSESGIQGTAPVSGVVKQKGAPVEGATVTFGPLGQGSGRAASGKTDASGKFTLTTLKAGDGALPGDYEVTVTKTETVGKIYTEEESHKYYDEHQKMPPPPETKNILPEKYSKAATSGLKATVKKGKNEFNFEVD